MRGVIAVTALTLSLATTEGVAQPHPATWSFSDLPARVVTPVPAGSVRDEVYWFTSVDDGRETRRGLWLAHRADGSVERVPLREAVFAWGSEVVVWSVTRRVQSLRACDVMEPDPRRVERSACQEEVVTITRLPSGARQTLRRARCDGRSFGHFDRGFQLVGVLGPWLVVDEGTSEFSCGAHGSWETRQFAYDLRDGAERSVDATSFGALGEAARRRADAELRRRLVAAGDTMDVVANAGSDPVGSVGGLSVWVRPTGPSLRAWVSGYTCYACSSGRRSYTLSLEAPLDPLPDAVRGWMEPPPSWATEYDAGSRRSGWTTFTGAVAVRDAILARVRAR